MDAKAKSDDGEIVVRVNSGEFSVSEHEIAVLDILKLAKEHGLMPGEPDGYYLVGDKGKRTIEERIDVREECVFLTIPTRPTPVA